MYASFSGLITLPWNQLPSRANANVACIVMMINDDDYQKLQNFKSSKTCPAMVVSLCIRLFLPGWRLGRDQEYIRRLINHNDHTIINRNDHEEDDDFDERTIKMRMEVNMIMIVIVVTNY